MQWTAVHIPSDFSYAVDINWAKSVFKVLSRLSSDMWLDG